MPATPKLKNYDIIFESKARENLAAVLGASPKTLVMVWEDEKGVHCLSQPHSRGVIAGVLIRLLKALQLFDAG